jgi:MFS family permease
MVEAGGDPNDAALGALATAREFLALPRDVLVLSAAMFGFSLGFQMTFRYLPEYLSVLGAGAIVIGAYKSFSDLIGAVYPYAGGVISDRIGSRVSLTAFGVLSTGGFAIWWAAPALRGWGLPAWSWVFVGFVLAQAWKSFGLGATFALVKQSVPPDRLATGFASTEVFRRVGFLLGPLLAAWVLAAVGPFEAGFRWVIVIAIGFGAVATIVQHWLYEADRDSFGRAFEGLQTIRADLAGMPAQLRPLLVADVFVRFANGMVYAFFVIVVVQFLGVGFVGFGVSLAPASYFGVLLGLEMLVALAVMVPASKLARRTGLVPVVATGFLVYAVFPVLLILAPADQWLLAGLFAFSGLRFAGLPAHKALIVGPAEADAGGRVTGAYYLVRNTLVIPSGLVGGWLYAIDPIRAFGAASAVGLVGVAYFALEGREFDAYAPD